jgi:hypothetical protein
MEHHDTFSIVEHRCECDSAYIIALKVKRISEDCSIYMQKQKSTGTAAFEEGNHERITFGAPFARLL